MFLQIDVPVPREIPLPLPLPEWLLVFLLIVSFLLHIIFIHLMVGGSLLTLWAQIKGLKNKDYDTLAHEIAKTITVNKSLAVVLGVAPLLNINVLYPLYFYSSNALTGIAWIMIIPLVIVAFLLLYLHKYTWETLSSHKPLHITIIALAVAIFLFIPLIFLTNVNLMMFPEKWISIQGFLKALLLPNVFPRYLEFLGASLAVTGIFLVWYHSRKAYPIEKIYSTFRREDLKKISYAITTFGLSLQILFGLIVLFTLPSKGISYGVLGLMGAAGALLLYALWYSYQSLVQEGITHLKKIVVAMAGFMVLYGSSRQLYRHNALEQHQKLVALRTAEFIKLSEEARTQAQSKEQSSVPQSQAQVLAPKSQETHSSIGQKVFQQYCAACHKPNERLVGPPISEMTAIYKGNKEALKKWIVSPGKKRADMPQMPGFPHLSQDELEEITNYILSFDNPTNP